MTERELIRWDLTPKQAQLLSEALMACAMAVQHATSQCLQMCAAFERDYRSLDNEEYFNLLAIVQTTAKEACDCEACLREREKHED